MGDTSITVIYHGMSPTVLYMTVHFPPLVQTLQYNVAELN